MTKFASAARLLAGLADELEDAVADIDSHPVAVVDLGAQNAHRERLDDLALADLREGLRRPAADGDYRAALREVARLLYTNENLYARSQGGHDVEHSAVWRDSAPRAWGDALYERLGLPPEAEYR